MIRLTLPLPPSSNRYWRLARGILHRSSEAKAYKIAVEHALLERDFAALDGVVCVTMRIYRARKSGDLDNKIKVLLDSLNGICWRDDKQIEEIHAYRFDDAKNPRVEVEITKFRGLGGKNK